MDTSLQDERETRFYALYEHQEGIRRHIATVLTTSPDLIDDALQNTWINVWRALPSMMGEGKSWLYQIAHNAAVDLIRKNASHPTLSLTAHLNNEDEDEKNMTEEALPWSDETDTWIEQIDREHLLRPALQQLREQERIVIALDYHEYSGQEGAQMLGLHLANYKTRLFRSRQRMRVLLAGEVAS